MFLQHQGDSQRATGHKSGRSKNHLQPPVLTLSLQVETPMVSISKVTAFRICPVTIR